MSEKDIDDKFFAIFITCMSIILGGMVVLIWVTLFREEPVWVGTMTVGAGVSAKIIYPIILKNL